MTNKLLKFTFAFFVSLSFGYLIYIAPYLIEKRSNHPVLVTLLSISVLLLFVVGIVKGNRNFYLFLFLCSFPFLEVYQMGVNVTILFAMFFCLLFRSELFLTIEKQRYLCFWPFVLICFASVFSLFLSNDWGEHIGYIVFYFAFFIFLISFLTVVDNKDKMEKAGWIIVILSLFCSLITICQLFFGVESIRLFTNIHEHNVKVARGVFRYPSIFWEAQMAGLYFCVTSILILGFYKHLFQKNKFVLLTFVLSLFSLFLTGTRIALFALPVSIFLVLEKKRSKIISCIFLITAFLIFYNFSPLQTTDRFNLTKIIQNTERRIHFWENGFELFKHNPLGVGFGGGNLYKAAQRLGLHGSGIKSIKSTAQFESAYLDVLCSLGVIGAIGFLMFFYRYFRIGHKLYIYRDKLQLLNLSKYFMGAMIAWMICVGTAPLSRHDQPMFLYFLLVGLMGSLVTMYKYNEDKKIG